MAERIWESQEVALMSLYSKMQDVKTSGEESRGLHIHSAQGLRFKITTDTCIQASDYILVHEVYTEPAPIQPKQGSDDRG
jgi:hypothetical protein